jgi:hypothetical protein
MGFVGPRPALYTQHDLIKLRTEKYTYAAEVLRWEGYDAVYHGERTFLKITILTGNIHE